MVGLISSGVKLIQNLCYDIENANWGFWSQTSCSMVDFRSNFSYEPNSYRHSLIIIIVVKLNGRWTNVT